MPDDKISTFRSYPEPVGKLSRMQCADEIVAINVYFYHILWQIYDLKYGETPIQCHLHLAAKKDGENKISHYILLQFAATLDKPPRTAGEQTVALYRGVAVVQTILKTSQKLKDKLRKTKRTYYATYKYRPTWAHPGKITHAQSSAHGKRSPDEKHLLQHEDIFTSWKR